MNLLRELLKVSCVFITQKRNLLTEPSRKHKPSDADTRLLKVVSADIDCRLS